MQMLFPTFASRVGEPDKQVMQLAPLRRRIAHPEHKHLFQEKMLLKVFVQ